MREGKLRQILKLFEESDVEELELEHSFWRGTRVRLSKRRPIEAVSAPAVVSAAAAAPPAPVSEVAASSAAPEPKEPTDDGLHRVLSPMVGTFYRSPSPESDAFVSEGASIQSGQTLCIVEAMKIMNEIPADIAGQVVGILVNDGDPVEYNQPLFTIRPS